MGSPRVRAPVARAEWNEDDDERTLDAESEERALKNPGVRRARAVVDAAASGTAPPVAPPRQPPAQLPLPAARALADAKTAQPTYARGRELAALLYFAAATFLALALASYDERGGADWVGPVGARFARATVTALGVVAWAIPVELALFSLPYLRGRPSVLTPARAAGDVVLAATGAALVHVGTAGRPVFGGHASGGLIGELFGELLRALFSTVGTFLVGLTTIALVLIARAAFSFIEFANRTGRSTAVVADRAATSMRTIAEAWQQAKEIERAGGGVPEIVPNSAHEDDLSRESELPLSPGVERSEIRMRKDVGVGREAHAIARKLAGVHDDAESDEGPAELAPDLGGAVLEATPAPSNAPGKSDTFAPKIVLSGAPEVAGAVADSADKPKSRTRKKKEALGPTIADPPPEAAQQRALSEASSASPLEVAASASAVSAERDEASGATSGTIEAAGAANESDEEVEGPASLIDASPAPEPVAAIEPKPAEKPVRRIVPLPKKIFRLPSPELLQPPDDNAPKVDKAALLADAEALVATLSTYKVGGEVREIHPGPVVTTFEFEPKIGTKVREVEGLANDLRLSLAKESVRIIAPIPGKNRIGFELPNASRVPVNLRELVEDRRFAEAKGALPVVLGRDIVGAPFFADLAAMPHLLVAGATGAGKSVGLNVMLTSLLYRRTPEDLKMIMIDPKVVELAPFDRIPHMLLPVVTDMKQALNALKWAVDEMERRYQLLAQAGVKNIGSYNHWCERVAKGEVKNPLPKTVTAIDHNGLPEEIVAKDQSVGEQPLPEKLPYLVIVVDEFADLMMSVGKGEVEPPIARLAQKARAAGIHVVLATQRPSVDVITGMIKANFPTRIAFRVAQRVDSRTILDAQGAEYLLGKGDMLVSLNGTNGLRRIQCPFVSEEEVEHVTHFWRSQGEPQFDESILAPREEDAEFDEADDALSPKDQEIYERAVEMVREARKCSTSWLQRKMGLGYQKAARFVDRMERMGIVGPAVGAGKDREILG